MPIASAALTAANAAVTDANNLSIAQVASMAEQGLTTDGQSIASTLQSALNNATGAAPGGTLSTDPATAAVLAAGLAQTVAPIVRTDNSPTGTMPIPAPVSNSTSFSATGDYQTVVAAPGNATGSVSGTGDTISATGGIQTITVTGPGNTISTGPYNDTVTVKTAGNTFNLGGGNDTIVLAYPGQTAPTAINADAAAVPPLASAGNIFVVPAPGTGVLTVMGTMASNDRFDLSKALAGTTWNGSPSTMWNYVNASATASGCAISVGGVTVLQMPNGAPSEQIGSFIVASH